MRAGRRELERAAGTLLTADVGEVGRVGLGLFVRALRGRRSQFATEVGDGLGEMAHGDRLDAAELGLAGGLRCAQDLVEPGSARSFGHRERAPNRPDPPVERELADGRMPGELLGRELAAASTARAIERSKPDPSFQAAGREVDRDPLQRPLEARRPDPASDAVLASAHARSASPTIAKPGRPSRCGPRPRPAAARGRRARG